MCDDNFTQLGKYIAETKNLPSSFAAKRSHSRTKIWDIDQSLHCSIIGTCLSLGDLRKLATRLDIRFKTTPSDYDIHIRFVNLAKGKNPASRNMQKLLDRRHNVSISRFTKARNAQSLEQIWDEAFSQGDVAGAFWALMSHPALTPQLQGRGFSDVHMLSHIAGASNRLNMKKLQKLEDTKRDLKRCLEEEQRLRHRLMKEQTCITNELEARRHVMNDAESRARHLEQELSNLQSEVDAQGLSRRIGELEHKLSECMHAHDRTSERLRERERDILELSMVNGVLSDDLVTLKAEYRLVEELASFPPSPCQSCEDKPAFETDLGGRCILYVGGRPQQACRYRDVVERFNGVFLHHDGGREQSTGALEGALMRADIVLFPTDCISHSAMHKIKDRCSQCTKMYVPVRTTGLGSFVSGLHQALDMRTEGEASRCEDVPPPH